jgi:predicted AAA+ superfamily ATPase
LFQEKLLKTKSISKNQIIEYDFNKIELQEIAYKELCYQIKAKAQKNKVNYVFLDEVQEIPS